MSEEWAPEYDGYAPAPSDDDLADHSPRCTDAANGEILATMGRDRLRWVHSWARWLVWDGRRWSQDGADVAALGFAIRCMREMHLRVSEEVAVLEKRFAAVATSKEQAEDIQKRLVPLRAIVKHYVASQNKGRLDAALVCARVSLGVNHVDLDQHPWTLNCPNGQLDLRTGILSDPNPDDLLTQITNTEWDDSATCPIWDRFIAQIACGDTLLLLYLQRIMGMAIAGGVRENVLVFFFGEGDNGKSTLFDTILGVLGGGYSCMGARTLLVSNRAGSDTHPTEIADLYGKRFVTCEELSSGQRLDEGKVKWLTGGADLKARRMNEDFWSFKPVHTIFMSGNSKPKIHDDTRGMWRRLKLVPWRFTVSNPDTQLKEKLAGERAGILRWLVAGCVEWQRVGMSEPPVVVEATEEYRRDSDAFGQFLSELAVVEPAGRIKKTALREAYETWCRGSGREPLGDDRVTQRLKKLGCTAMTVRAGSTTGKGWAGIRLKTQQELYSEAEPEIVTDYS